MTDVTKRLFPLDDDDDLDEDDLDEDDDEVEEDEEDEEDEETWQVGRSFAREIAGLA